MFVLQIADKHVFESTRVTIEGSVKSLNRIAILLFRKSFGKEQLKLCKHDISSDKQLKATKVLIVILLSLKFEVTLSRLRKK